MFIRIFEFIMEYLIPPIIVVLLVGLFIAIPYFAYQDYKQSNSPTFELYKNEWTCTESASQRVNVMVGKVMTTQYRNVCVNYSWTNKE